jgi:hypothetical protein
MTLEYLGVAHMPNNRRHGDKISAALQFCPCCGRYEGLMIKEYFSNLGKTYSLKPKYYALTSFIGLAGVFIGLALGALLLLSLASACGINIDETVTDGTTKAIMFFCVIFGFSFSIYLGCVISAGCFSVIMLLLNKFTAKQAVGYTFLSSYPDSWFKEYS